MDSDTKAQFWIKICLFQILLLHLKYCQMSLFDFKTNVSSHHLILKLYSFFFKVVLLPLLHRNRKLAKQYVE